ncbi:MAG TPA: hypothetical protein VEA80_00420 [Vitreimonas sp.]|uniref:hypothetical protein n=1 Tax=Vitreimonas sp. TaxID=3069702 RepID=UPI002D23D074|nr:hypothetical protein [Vitreimonas sp.]HYD85914.1 hypothetical protein [Vitreimonas sp.]
MIADWPKYAGIAALGLGAIVIQLVMIWRYISSGRVLHQRTYSGAPVTREETPIFFWLHVALLVVMIAGFAWFVVHVTGYMLGWWGWAIGS